MIKSKHGYSLFSDWLLSDVRFSERVSTYNTQSHFLYHGKTWSRKIRHFQMRKSCYRLNSLAQSICTHYSEKWGTLLFEKSRLKKTRSFFIQKEKRPGCLFSFWITMTLVFCTLFFSKSRVPNFQKAGCLIFKNSGCRLTGRLCYCKLTAKKKVIRQIA